MGRDAVRTFGKFLCVAFAQKVRRRGRGLLLPGGKRPVGVNGKRREMCPRHAKVLLLPSFGFDTLAAKATEEADDIPCPSSSHLMTQERRRREGAPIRPQQTLMSHVEQIASQNEEEKQ